MTRDSFLALLREIEWEGGLPEPWCEGANPCCPSCGNEAGPHHLRAHAQHEKGCKLAEAIAWLADEGNQERLVRLTMPAPGQLVQTPVDGWVLR